MRNLNFALKQMCQRSRDGSYATQRDRERGLDPVAGHFKNSATGTSVTAA